MVKRRSVFLLFLFVTALVWAEERGEVVDGVDLRQFEGTWYEIARLPNKHQKGMVEVTSTLKRTRDGKYVLITSGYKGSRGGRKTTVKGEVRVKDPENAGEMKIKMFVFSIDYRVIDLDRDNYRYALITTDSDKFLWILSRSPEMKQAEFDMLVDSARRQGFDVDRLVLVSQESNSAIAGR